jgi:hypothetical protein
MSTIEGPNRLASVTVYNEADMPPNRHGYHKDIKVYCLLNENIEAFTIRYNKTLFMKPTYTLDIPLVYVHTHRPFGRGVYKSLEEARSAGIRLLRIIFPKLNLDITVADVNFGE